MKLKILALFFLIPMWIHAQTIHTMAKGETLYSLSRQYGVSVDTIIKTNKISNPQSVNIGSRLIISDGKSPTIRSEKRYRVEKGDTYYGIARRFEIKVNELLRANGRNDSMILIVGEYLNIPNQHTTVNTAGSNAFKASEIQVSVNRERHWWPVNGKKKSLDGKLKGVAIEAEPLSYVHSVANGRVVWTGPYRGFGNVVLVDSQGYIYLYGGNDDLFVNIGQNVVAGSKIGRLGYPSSGNAASMYFAVFHDGVPVAPDNAPRS